MLDAYRAADLAAARQRRARRQAELTEGGGGGAGGGDDPGLIDMPRSTQVAAHQDAHSVPETQPPRLFGS